MPERNCPQATVDILFFRPQGPQPTEAVGLEDIRLALPRQWRGFANFIMRQPNRRGQDREIDLVIIATDRLILVDLKHIRGRIENRGGFWYRGDENLGSSPAHKIRDNAKILASLLRSEVPQLPAVPPVESLVVLTHPLSDPSGQYHARAIQDRYRELFRAGMKERVAWAAARLGLDRNYVSEALELEAVFGSLFHQIELCEADIASGMGPDVVSAAQDRLDKLKEVWSTALKERSLGDDGEPRSVLEQLRDDLAFRHAVNDPDARRRLLRLLTLAHEWTSVLGIRHRSLEELLARSRNLICGTCVGIGRPGIQLDKNAFDFVIIDEAARCTPSELAVGMQSGRRILLVGDHRQLPPLYDHNLLKTIGPRMGIMSLKELQRSDFERSFHSDYGRAVARSLKKQYRMAPKINDVVATAFYRGQELKPERGPPPAHYELLPRPLDDELTWIDTGHSKSWRRETTVGSSYANRREANAILALLLVIARTPAFLEAAKGDAGVH
jgi:hypothetical protein